MSRLPIKNEPTRYLSTARASSTKRSTSTSRASSTNRGTYGNPTTASLLRRSKSSISLLRTPQSASQTGSRNKSADRGRVRKREIRPLQDKNWQAQMLEMTQSYFQQFPEARKILLKGVRMRPITLNMFVQLTNFVLRMIHSKFSELTLANYKELLPNRLNILKYPGNVTATMLKTANTIHSWPHILGILSWLVQLQVLLASMDAEQLLATPPEDASIEVKLKHLRTVTILDSFAKWNQQEDLSDVRQKIEEQVRKIYNFPIGYDDELNSRIKELQDKLNDELIILEKSNEEIAKIKNDENVLIMKDKKLKSQIEDQKQKKICIGESIASRQREYDNLRKRIEAEKAKSKDLKVRIKNQPMSLAQKMEHKKVIEDVENTLKLQEKKNLHQLQVRDQKDIELSEIKIKLEIKVNDYNIQLLNHPAFKDFDLPVEKLNHPDIKLIIAEKLEKTKKLLKKLNKDIKQKQLSIEVLKSNIEQERQKINENNKANNVEQQKLNKCISEFDELVKSYENDEKLKQEKINDLNKKILEQKSAVPDIQTKLAELKQLKARTKELETFRTSKLEEMLRFFQTLEKHVKEIQIPSYRKLKEDLVRQVADAQTVSSIPQDIKDQWL